MGDSGSRRGFSSVASVEIDRPSRYAKQLATHMGHKAHTTETEQGWELFFDPSRATLTPRDTDTPPTLAISVWSPTDEGLESIQQALERHLQQFTTRRGGVSVVWKEG